MMRNFSKKSLLQRLSADADQAELKAVIDGESTLESGFSDDRIASAMDDFDVVGAGLDWQHHDLENDSAVGGLYEELIRRRELMGDFYPFKLKGNAIEYHLPCLTYNFCLAISNINVSDSPYKDFPHIFELVTMEYSKLYFGDYAKSFHTGWPRSPGQPKNFKALSDELYKKSGEWHWGPDAELKDSDSNAIKDGGIDFVTWLETPDERRGKLFYLGQCACGNNWNTKFNDIKPSKYNTWFNPATLIPPTTVFCIPFSIVDGYLYEASKESGLVLDRIRLTMLAKKYEKRLPDNLRASMQKCVNLVCGFTK